METLSPQPETEARDDTEFVGLSGGLFSELVTLLNEIRDIYIAYVLTSGARRHCVF